MTLPKTGATPAQARSESFLPSGQLFPFSLVAALFFLWAVPNNLNDVLIRQFMTSFSLTRLQAGLVQSAFYMGYFLLAMPAALLMRRFGYKLGFLTGLFLFGLGAILFWPAALVNRYSFFLAALFVLAAGLSFLETSASPFMAQFGSLATSERRLNFAQAFNPLGSITGVLVGTIFISSGVQKTAAEILHMKAIGQYAPYLHSQTMRVVRPYVVLGLIVWFWGLMIARTKFPPLAAQADPSERRGRLRELLAYPGLMLAVVAQFLYVGAQVGTWSYFIFYAQEYAHQPEKVAGYLLTGSLVAFAVGRFVTSWIMRFVAPGPLMGWYSIANVILVGLGVAFPGWFGLWCILLTSFFMSLMYPTIFALGIKDLGPNTKLGASVIVMSIVGGAALTPLMGWIAEVTHGEALAYLVPLAAYIFVAGFSFSRFAVSAAGADAAPHAAAGVN